MSSNLRQLEEDLASLNEAIRAGIVTVSVGGQTTVFASIDKMQKVASDLERQIADCKGIAARRPRASSFRLDRGV
jgi:hypothetical protein